LALYKQKGEQNEQADSRSPLAQASGEQHLQETQQLRQVIGCTSGRFVFSRCFYYNENMLRIRKIKSSDWQYFCKWWKDEDLAKLTSGVSESSEQVLRGYFKDMLKNSQNYYFMVEVDGQVIGNVSLVFEAENVFEIQIVIGEKEFWEQGYGTEAILLSVEFAKTKLNAKKIILKVRRENLRAIRAYEKCGFELTEDNPKSPFIKMERKIS